MEFLFFFIILAVLFSLHFIVYFFLIFSFDIIRQKIKIIFRIIFLLLPFSFIISSFLAGWRENVFTKIIYMISGLWLGLLSNLLVGIFVFSIIKAILKPLNININLKIFSILIIFCAIFYMGFGFYNVYHPHVESLNINIKDLPSEWKGKKIVQLSDVHLGRVLGENFFNKVIDMVNSLDAEAVFITGDYFDGMGSDLDKYAHLLDRIKSRKGVYFITGNHETYLGVEDVFSSLGKTNVNVLNDKIVNLNGVQIIGVSFRGGYENKNVKDVFNDADNFNRDDPAILLYHAPTSVFSEGSNNHSDIYFSPNVDFEAVQNLGIDLQLSGHTHKGQIFPFNFVTRLIYGELDYGLHYLGDFAIYTSSGTGVWGPTMRTGSRSEIVEITLQ